MGSSKAVLIHLCTGQKAAVWEPPGPGRRRGWAGGTSSGKEGTEQPHKARLRNCTYFCAVLKRRLELNWEGMWSRLWALWSGCHCHPEDFCAIGIMRQEWEEVGWWMWYCSLEKAGKLGKDKKLIVGMKKTRQKIMLLSVWKCLVWYIHYLSLLVQVSFYT